VLPGSAKPAPTEEAQGELATVAGVRTSRLPLVATVAGAVVGVAVAAGLVLSGALRVPVQRDLSDAQDEFLRAWERSRRATYVSEGEFTRRKPDGTTLTSPTETVQRPPDRLVRRFGGVNGTLDGHVLLCTSDAGPFRCAPGTEVAPPYDATVAEEVATFRSYFSPPAPGARALYRVIRAPDPGCYDLVQQLPYDDAPYGTDARLCFDERTGAVRRVDRRFENGIIESEEATRLTGDVRDSDFAAATATDTPGQSPGDEPEDPALAPGGAGAASGTTLSR
jgi:hypothetical protein